MQVVNIDLFSMGQVNVNLGGSRKLTVLSPVLSDQWYCEKMHDCAMQII